MIKFKKIPPAKYLRRCFEYNRETGQVFWKNRPREHFSSQRGWNSWNAKHAGNQAFTSRNEDGHMMTILDYVLYTAGRIIWKWVTGKDPVEQVDHKNRDPSDNRWVNLREASAAQNARNRSIPANNTSGRVGVYFYKPTKNWKASIRIQKQQVHLGTFDTKEEAMQARAVAERLHYGEFTAQ